MHIPRIAAVSVGCLLAGCSAVQVAYNNADWWLLRTADRYLSPTSQQRDYLRDAFETSLEQHRRDELRDYVDFFDRAAAAVSEGLTRSEAQALIAELESLLLTTIANIIPAITPVMADLSEAQIEHLSRRIDKKNREFRTDYLQANLEKRLQARANRVIRRIERWSGRLSPEQRKLAMVVTRAWPDAGPQWYEYHLARQSGLLGLLREGATADQLAEYLAHWWVELKGQSPELQSQVRQTRQGLASLLLAVDATLDEQHRQQIVRRLAHYRDQLKALLPKERVIAKVGSLPTTPD